MERERIVCQGSIPEFKNDGDEHDKYYLPSRGLVLPGSYHLLPDKDIIMTYANQFNEIISSELGLPPRKIVPIPDSHYLLDKAILDNLSRLIGLLNQQFSYKVYPYAVTEPLLEWVEKLKEKGFNIEPMFPKKVYFENLRHPAHRGGWGRWVNEPDQRSFPELARLPYPVSWIGTSLDEIKEAYCRVCEETGTSKAFIKPVFSAGGFTLRKIEKLGDLVESYEELKKQGVLQLFDQEIPIEVQAWVEDIKGFYSMQHMKGKLVTPGGICQQIVDGTQWQGNLFNPPNLSGEIVNQAMEIWKNFSELYPNIKNEWGGLDLALNEEGKLIILEHNGQRITGAIPPIALASQLGVLEMPFAAMKSPGEPNCDLLTLWKCLKNYYNPHTKQRIFPIIWVAGSGMLFAAGENPIKLLEETYRVLEKLGYIN